ncbi:2-keto-4-pentenoate hydratase/2-oxohepta-3-ene-1,7-dioic acid hydratase (catechol pathway) [Fulvimarina manganoxydans]|uniref:2-keto-4-pentenoate hydratase/2-oxohepta-3-ene-1,7-dioic acid hydratase (Catechol pathway) n=1 Tax=Fulvimarina manganoxydans TaxID=937218 RepID=A0A1W2EAH7_9HYPH|nr:fumarylacetoacetate hydrolase family protein [Fulvimarina manganoxydans]SMD06336.1 2-keto-4-pentenoate hydratase/2-oxohepta-3-ene-1,7-dioic acid hydratase (catechol pathway) [Fulvimarina manganoxydans]
MAMNLAHFEIGRRRRWGLVKGDAIAPLDQEYPTTAALIEHGETGWIAASGRAASVSLADVTLLSPVTAPARILCQGANYRQHMIESGMDPDEKTFNMFFEKADCSLNAPRGTVRKPPHVRLLDYEIELALVFRKAITAPVTVTEATLSEYVFAIAIANDVSARDIQIPQTQFFKGKSYRGFCPMGPYLTVLEPEEFHYLDRLDLSLSVNGAERQRDTTRNLVFKPAETITELSTFSDIAPGDVLLTGTPSGCALRVPPPALRKLMQLVLPEKKLWAAFERTQSRRPQYLKAGDVVTARIKSPDGIIDLGEQRVTISA